MIQKRLQKYLDEKKAIYQIVNHKKVFTAYDAAATIKVNLGSIAKSLLVKFNKPFVNNQKPYALIILGADKKMDLKKLAKIVNTWTMQKNKALRLVKPDKGKKVTLDIYNKVSKIMIPKEKDLKEKLKINPGAISAFGSLYKLPVFVDNAFLKNKEAIFSSGSFTESIKMKIKDYLSLEDLMAGNFSMARVKKSKKKVVAGARRKGGLHK